MLVRDLDHLATEWSPWRGFPLVALRMTGRQNQHSAVPSRRNFAFKKILGFYGATK
jgi:hypothetical protein